MFEFTIKNKMKFVIYDSLITVTYLSVNNYYGINDCNTIYMSLWKNENIVFFLNYLYFFFF